jgi:hypothetical protein
MTEYPLMETVEATVQKTDRLCGWEDVFTAVRRLCVAEGLRHIALVRPNQSILCLPCPAPGSVRPEYIADVERIVPSVTRRNIAAIAPTLPKIEPADVNAIPGTLDVIAMGRVIPFFGMLVGLTSIGHSVWVFDGQPATLAPGSRDSDVLVIDSIMAAKLTTKSADEAARVMRNANILIYDRNTRGLRALRQVGPPGASLEFRQAESS